MRKFNVTGLCVPKRHYMANVKKKIDKIADMVYDGQYFTINRARQYGKTTTLNLLEASLKNEYIVISISFEGMGNENFKEAAGFCRVFLSAVQEALVHMGVDTVYSDRWNDTSIVDFDLLSKHITKLCKDKKSSCSLMK